MLYKCTLLVAITFPWLTITGTTMDNTFLGGYLLASTEKTGAPLRRHRTDSLRDRISVRRYFSQAHSPETPRFSGPYCGILAPRRPSQVSVEKSRPPYRPHRARSEPTPSAHSAQNSDTPFLIPSRFKKLCAEFPEPSFDTPPCPPQHSVPSGHVTDQNTAQKRSSFLQQQSKSEPRPRALSFLPRLKKKGAVRSAGEESPPALSLLQSTPKDKYEQRESRFLSGTSAKGGKKALALSLALGSQSSLRQPASDRREPFFTLANNLLQREKSWTTQEQAGIQGCREKLLFSSSPTEEPLAANCDIIPPIPRKSSQRRRHTQGGEDLGSCLQNLQSDISKTLDSITPAQENGANYSDSEYSEIEEDLLPAPLKIVKNTPKNSTATGKNKPFLELRETAHRDIELPLAFHVLERPIRTMSGLLQVSAVTPKTKAEEDAALMQASVIEAANKTKTTPPPYVLLELIGKGSFGRVYKGRHVSSLKTVAVKIIDLDENDTLNPRLANTYSEFMKEVNALKIMSESKARNINHVIEALPVGKTMWMITEYCGGGSIATLIKPTPSGLKERYIIPILREVAEAIKWVHQAGIIHRDLKCANVLITEKGDVQLCDFGVAGITDTPLDKRSTWIGTLNWMAPELLEGLQYGKEVDIWAFGSMAYEMATGLPPNAKSGVTGPDLGPYLRQHIPRLEGGNYSEGLRSFVAYCLEENASERPSIEAVQEHPYIYDTSTQYPTSTLSELVRAFKLWQDDGGSRRSLFMGGGAQGPSEISLNDLGDDWNFSTTAAFDQSVAQGANFQDVLDVYGVPLATGSDLLDETSRPARPARQTRRRPPPEALAPIKAPLEKIFDPNTTSNYEENSRNHYNLTKVSDLPLRDNSAQTSIKDTMIDLDAQDVETGPPQFQDMDTIRATRDDNREDEYDGIDFSRPPLSDPADNLNRRTQDWKFPVLAPPASANPELSCFPTSPEPRRLGVTPGFGGRPALIHHPTEPIVLPSQELLASSSPTRMSLIDLDLSLPEPSRPSTADSTMSQEMLSTNPFHLERHASLMHPPPREPSLYIVDDLNIGSGNPIQDLAEVSDFSASEAEGTYDQYSNYDPSVNSQVFNNGVFTGAEFEQPDFPAPLNIANPGTQSQTSNNLDVFDFPPPPSVAALSGTATSSELGEEMTAVINRFCSQLASFKAGYEQLPTKKGKKRNQGGE